MTFNTKPTLTGNLLTLRPVQEDDFDPLFAVASDPKIWEQHPARDRYRESIFRKFFAEALESGGALVALENSMGKIIGSSRFHGYNPDMKEIEIGWSFLSRKYWGGVYNKEMKSLMLNYSFQYVDQVLFLVGPDNIRSRKAMEKIGGIQSGIRKNAYGLESLVYLIGKDDYFSN